MSDKPAASVVPLTPLQAIVAALRKGPLGFDGNYWADQIEAAVAAAGEPEAWRSWIIGDESAYGLHREEPTWLNPGTYRWKPLYASPVAQGWQPIREAPYNKTRVALAHFSPDRKYQRYGQGYYMPLTGWQGWDAPDGIEPTHFVPLPEPPRDER